MAHSMSWGRPKWCPACRASAATARTSSSARAGRRASSAGTATRWRPAALPGAGRWADRLSAMSRVEDVPLPVHSKGVGRLFAGYQSGAEAVGGRDHGHAAPAGDRVGAEGHAGSARVDHSLDQDRRRPARRRKPVRPAVGQETFAEGGTPDRRHRLGHLGRRDEEKALELPGEGVLGSILVDGRGADGHRFGVWAEPGKRRGEFAARLRPQGEVRLEVRCRGSGPGVARALAQAGVEALGRQDEPGGDADAAPVEGGEGRGLAAKPIHRAGLAGEMMYRIPAPPLG